MKQNFSLQLDSEFDVFVSKQFIFALKKQHLKSLSGQKAIGKLFRVLLADIFKFNEAGKVIAHQGPQSSHDIARRIGMRTSDPQTFAALRCAYVQERKKDLIMRKRKLYSLTHLTLCALLTIDSFAQITN